MAGKSAPKVPGTALAMVGGMLLWTICLLASVLVGITLGLLGGGGSILTVPLLVYGFGLGTHEAITTSLFVVGVTSAGHGYARPAGVLSAAFAMDERLAASGAAYRALSLPFYLENLLGQAEGIRERGVFSLAAPGDRPFATVATSDVAVEAAELLTARDWSGREDVPLFGPDRLTLEQLAAVMSEELGRAVAYRPMSIDELASAMRAGGATEQAVRDTTEMFAAQVDGIYDADWARAKTGTTDVRSWCRTVLAPRV